MSKKVFLIGADPEFILLKDGKNFSAEGIIGHGKFDPLDMGNGIAVQEDNILIEFNIPPAPNKVEFLRSNLKALHSIWHTFLKEKGLTISKECYGEFDEASLNTEQAQAVGCSPEFDAYSCSMIDPPQLDRTAARTAGGHVHIGYEGENLYDSMMIVKMLDLYLGIPSLILDKDKKRRAIYGKPSSYRRNEGIKVEYRTLSNFWLFDKALIDWVYDVVEKVVNDVLNGAVIDDELYMRVRHTINSNDEEEAAKIIAEQPDMIMPSSTHLDLLEKVYTPDRYTEEFIAEVPSDEFELMVSEEISEFEKNEIEAQRHLKANGNERKGASLSHHKFRIPNDSPSLVPNEIIHDFDFNAPPGYSLGTSGNIHAFFDSSTGQVTTANIEGDVSAESVPGISKEAMDKYAFIKKATEQIETKFRAGNTVVIDSVHEDVELSEETNDELYSDEFDDDDCFFSDNEEDLFIEEISKEKKE